MIGFGRNFAPHLPTPRWKKRILATGNVSIPAGPAETVSFIRAGSARYKKFVEDGKIKAFGAGILSSFGEMQHMAGGNAELVAFDPGAKLPAMSYKDGYQRRYFALDSFERGAAQLAEYCAHLQARLPEGVRAAVAEAVAAS